MVPSQFTREDQKYEYDVQVKTGEPDLRPIHTLRAKPFRHFIYALPVACGFMCTFCT